MTTAQDSATINDAPAFLNMNDKAMWVLGYNAARASLPREAEQEAVAWLVLADGDECKAFISEYEIERFISQQKRGGSPYTFTTKPLYTHPTPPQAGALPAGEGDITFEHKYGARGTTQLPISSWDFALEAYLLGRAVLIRDLTAEEVEEACSDIYVVNDQASARAIQRKFREVNNLLTTPAPPAAPVAQQAGTAGAGELRDEDIYDMNRMRNCGFDLDDDLDRPDTSCGCVKCDKYYDRIAHQATTRPFDDKGRFVSRICPRCDCGTLQPEGDSEWVCDGLADPGHPNQPLEACTYTHQDRTPKEPS